MRELPAFPRSVEAPGWRNLIEMAPQLMDAPRGLGQHVGGLVLSSSPIPEMVPTRAGAMEGRYIMDWNKDSVADAGFAKIDLLSLPVLDQLRRLWTLSKPARDAVPTCRASIPGDPEVYDLINQGRAKAYSCSSPRRNSRWASASIPVTCATWLTR